jgi:hypothetical protein
MKPVAMKSRRPDPDPAPVCFEKGMEVTYDVNRTEARVSRTVNKSC